MLSDTYSHIYAHICNTHSKSLIMAAIVRELVFSTHPQSPWSCWSPRGIGWGAWQEMCCRTGPQPLWLLCLPADSGSQPAGCLELRNPPSRGWTLSRHLQPPFHARSSRPLLCYLSARFLQGRGGYHSPSASREDDISMRPSCPWAWPSTRFPLPWALRTGRGTGGKDKRLTTPCRK